MISALKVLKFSCCKVSHLNVSTSRIFSTISVENNQSSAEATTRKRIKHKIPRRRYAFKSLDF